MKNIFMTKGIITGVWDLLHAGHVLAFKEAKQHCDFLIVGLNVDPHDYKVGKNRPIETQEERTIRLEGCKYVDKIIPYFSEEESLEIIKRENPDIRFIGDDWKGKQYGGHDMNIKTIFINRDHGFSSSSLRDRIKNAI